MTTARVWLDQELERVVRRRVAAPAIAPPLTLATTSPPAYGSAYSFAYGNTSGSANFYNGPALTDADVRRIERGEE